jgi:hypothetical protein
MLFAALLSILALIPTTDEEILYLCRYDLTQYVKGDKTWLERQLPRMPVNTQNRVVVACKFYFQGLDDGVKLGQGPVNQAAYKRID